MSLSASNTRKTSMPFSAAFVDEAIDHVVLVVAVAEQVLARAAASAGGVLGMRRRKVRRRSQGSSLRKRMQESKVAPPQHSTDQKPALSRSSQAGTMSSSAMRVAIRLW